MPHDTPEMPSFLLPATTPLSRWAALAHPPPSTGGHVGRFRFWAFVNRAAPSIHVLVQIFMWTYVSIFLGVALGARLLGHLVSPCFTF